MQQLQQQVEALAQTAISHAQQQFAIRLDYSESSIAEVERILGALHDSVLETQGFRLFKRRPDLTDLAGKANAYGAYLGEVIRRICGGEWSYTEICGCRDILLLRIGADLNLLPTTKTWNRVTMGPSENVHDYFRRTLDRATRQQLKSAHLAHSAGSTTPTNEQ